MYLSLNINIKQYNLANLLNYTDLLNEFKYILLLYSWERL